MKIIKNILFIVFLSLAVAIPTVYFANADDPEPGKRGSVKRTPRPQRTRMRPDMRKKPMAVPSSQGTPLPAPRNLPLKKESDKQSKEEKKPLPEGMVRIDFIEGSIKELIKEFSEILEKNFTYDDSIKGSITLIGNKELSKWEAKKLFEASLERMGYTVIWGWPINKVVPISQAKSDGNIPVY